MKTFPTKQNLKKYNRQPSCLAAIFPGKFSNYWIFMKGNKYLYNVFKGMNVLRVSYVFPLFNFVTLSGRNYCIVLRYKIAYCT